jgi:hypothetical protein
VSSLYYHQTALSHLTQINADAKAVLILRDPAERAFSAYQYLRARGLEPEKEFRRALQLEETRRDKDWHHLWHYVGMSRYAESVAAWVECLGRDKVGIWFYEDFDTHTHEVVQDVMRFLGIQGELSPDVLTRRVNVSGESRSRLLATTLSALSKAEPLRRVVRAVTPFAAREAVRRANLRESSLSPSDRRAVYREVRDDVINLKLFLGTHGYRRPVWNEREW